MSTRWGLSNCEPRRRNDELTSVFVHRNPAVAVGRDCQVGEFLADLDFIHNFVRNDIDDRNTATPLVGNKSHLPSSASATATGRRCVRSRGCSDSSAALSAEGRLRSVPAMMTPSAIRAA